jgi:Neutral/alkaline non-lysosomal ceramidase, N-terminal
MFPRRLHAVLASFALLVSSLVANSSGAQAQEPEPDAITVLAGYGQADATWHVGAGAGQYSGKSPHDPVLGAGGSEFDPHGHSVIQKDSYGVQSRLSFRAIVVDDGEDQVALVKSDNYVTMDAVSRRVGQILAAAGSRVSYDEIFHMGSHNHYSPMYTTPSWGVWLFQDAFDIRAFEYQARQMASAILDAEADLQPAKMGGTTVDHYLFKGMVQRSTVADDGTPAAYPRDFGDFGLSVVRFDTLDGAPIATLINWGMHPEGLQADNLITAEWLAGVERFVGRATGGGVVIGQGDVGSSESGPGKPYEFPEGIFRMWNDAGHAQVERGAWLLSQDVIRAWNDIGAGNALAEFDSSFDVEAGNAWVPGPLSHPYPSVSNCRSETTVEGEPGVPIAGLPDCARGGGFTADDQVWETIKDLGVPVPDHYDAPSFTGVQENLRLHLQAFKLGEVILMSCACEAQVDLVLNLESRTNETQDDMWLGFDWTKRLDCVQASPPDGDWTCSRKPDDPAAPGSTFPDPLTFTDYEYDHMLAQIYNDAASWDAPENVLRAQSEPRDPEEIWGNFTHEELPDELGYKLPIAFGNASDYNGYTVSYREYMSWDDYRKALTPYGPHTADYMNTRLTRLAGELNGGPELPPEPHDVLAQADEARQVVFTTLLGALSSRVYDAWNAALPADVGPAVVTVEPESIARFDGTSFSWRGGSNAVDNPVVKVQRLVDGTWTDFADQSGEIQTRVKFPQGINGLVDTYRGAKEWIWTANFEAFNAFPAGIGSTPAGEYRFVVDGLINVGVQDTACSDCDPTDLRAYYPFPYHLESAPFTVSPWDGITVGDLAVGEDGSVSFSVNDSYPLTYDSVFPAYVRVHMQRETDRGELRPEEIRTWCDTCSFRPWATSGTVTSATVTITRVDGTVELVPASLVDGTWVAPVALQPGDTAFVDAGGVVDNYGEVNGAPSATVSLQ